MDTLNQWAGSISAAVWGMPMIILLLGTHIYLTIRLRFPQRHIFNALMAIPNLLCLLFLSGVIVKKTRKYLWSGRIDE